MSTDSRRNAKNLMLDRIQRKWMEERIDGIAWNWFKLAGRGLA